MEVSNRIVIFSRGNLEQIGAPQEVYERPFNEFVARFIGVLNVLELRVEHGVARLHELTFPTHGVAEGACLRIGFRPYTVQISPDLSEYRYRATLKHVYFLGVQLRLELETPSGLTLRTRITKDEFVRLGLAEDKEISFQIREYRVLSRDGFALSPEVSAVHQLPSIAENI